MSAIPVLPSPMRVDVEWASSLVRVLQSWIKSVVFGDHVVQGDLITQSGHIANQTLVTAATYSALLTDEVIDVNRAGAVTITMPAPLAQSTGKMASSTGQIWYVQDSSGAASSNTITISGGTKNINGGASVTLTTNYGRLMIQYNGTQFVSSA